MYAWEIPFKKVVNVARGIEMKSLKTSLFIRSTFLGFMLFTERSSMFFTALTLVLMGYSISAGVVSILRNFSKILLSLLSKNYK